MENYSYTPNVGQLCQTYKGYDAVFPISDCPESLVSYPLSVGEIIIITKVVYHESMSSFYIEFLRDNSLYYTYFYEQVVCFEQDDDGEVVKKNELTATFNFPWVLCE